MIHLFKVNHIVIVFVQILSYYYSSFFFLPPLWGLIIQQLQTPWTSNLVWLLPCMGHFSILTFRVHIPRVEFLWPLGQKKCCHGSNRTAFQIGMKFGRYTLQIMAECRYNFWTHFGLDLCNKNMSKYWTKCIKMHNLAISALIAMNDGSNKLSGHVDCICCILYITKVAYFLHNFNKRF